MSKKEFKKLQLELEHHLALSRIFRKKISGLEELLRLEMEAAKQIFSETDKIGEKVKDVDRKLSRHLEGLGIKVGLNGIWNFDKEKDNVERLEKYLVGLKHILPEEPEPEPITPHPEPVTSQPIPARPEPIRPEPVPPEPSELVPPASPPVEHSEREPEPEPADVHEAPEKPVEAPEFNGKRKILFVDDDPTVTKIFSHFFAKEDFEVLVATNGEEGLEKTRESQPDIILLDIMMPIMNGFEFLEQKKKEPNIAGIPVILVSSFSQDDEILKGLGSGALDYIVKPFSIPVLVAKVKKVLNIDDESTVSIQ